MTDHKMEMYYDHRFNAVVIVDGEQVLSHVRLSDILRNLEPYELQCALAEVNHEYVPEVDIEQVRRQAIIDSDPAGKVVLDIGGYDGVMAKVALDHGATRAIVLDNHQYEHYGWEDKKHGGVEYVQGDFMELVPGKNDIFQWVGRGEFYGPKPDIFIFYNVLYHLKNPWAALDHLRTLIKPDGVMLLCTLFRYHYQPWVYLYEPRECNPSDETVYWGPSIPALERLLNQTGWDFQQLGVCLDRVVYRCTLTPNWSRTHEDS